MRWLTITRVRVPTRAEEIGAADDARALVNAAKEENHRPVAQGGRRVGHAG